MDTNNSNSPVNPAETPTQPIQHPVNNQRGNLPIILGVLALLLVVGGGAYYLGTKNSSNIEQSKQTAKNSPSQQNTQIVIPTANPTASTNSNIPTNWKTHSDNMYGFSIQYPPNWIVDTDGQYYIRIKSPNQTPEGQEPNSGAIFEIEMHKQTSQVTLAKLQGFTQSTNTLQITSKNETTLQGNPAISYQAKDPTPAEIEGLNIGLNNGFLRILMKNFGKQLSDKETMQQILSSLKFSN